MRQYSEKQIESSKYRLLGYSLIHSPTVKRGGGVAMYVKNGITFKLREDISLFVEGNLYVCMFIQIHMHIDADCFVIVAQ